MSVLFFCKASNFNIIYAQHKRHITHLNSRTPYSETCFPSNMKTTQAKLKFCL